MDRMASQYSMVKVPTKHVALEPESFDVQCFYGVSKIRCTGSELFLSHINLCI